MLCVRVCDPHNYTKANDLLSPLPGPPHGRKPHPPDRVGRRAAPRLLIPLNVCRKDKLYLPWECENERHAYEK